MTHPGTEPAIDPEALRQALAGEALTLYYQPKVSMTTGMLCGAEALVRWVDGDRVIPPDRFIPRAEAWGMIGEITAYVFNRLVVDAALIGSVNDTLVLSFNASGRDFHDDRFAARVLQAVAGRLIPADRLEIEVTETVLLDGHHARACLEDLHHHGIAITMDDFGTGHSGLVNLSKWPFRKIKIDREIIQGIRHSDKNRQILQASIRMAHQLGLEVVAEGIEDEITYRQLQGYGCGVGQGYWIGHPLPLDAFIRFLQAFRNLPPMPQGLLYMVQLDHLQWRKNLIDAALVLHGLEEGSARDLQCLRGQPQLEHTACRLGQWYYGDGQIFGHIPAFGELETPHRELHEIGKALISAAQEHHAWERITTLIQALSRKSVQVLALLQELENHITLGHRSTASLSARR